MVFRKPPQTIWIRIIESTVVENHGGAEQRDAENLPRAHYPAHIGHPIHTIVLMNIQAVEHVLRSLDGKSTMSVQNPFGFAGCARSVDDHQWLFRVRSLRLKRCGAPRDLI